MGSSVCLPSVSPMNGRLEVTLLSVNHHPHILLLGVLKYFNILQKNITIFCVVRTTNLKDGVESVDHVPELLLLKGGESSIIVSSDERLHGAGLKVGHLEGVSQTLGVVNQAGPVEQVNQTEKRNASNDRQALKWSASRPR